MHQTGFLICQLVILVLRRVVISTLRKLRIDHMKKILFLASISAFVLSQSALSADTYVFNKAGSAMCVQVRHVFWKIPGKFNDFEGKIQFDEANPQNSSVEATIKTASIDTGVDKRDKDLRSARFFEAEKFPEITFKSKS